MSEEKQDAVVDDTLKGEMDSLLNEYVNDSDEEVVKTDNEESTTEQPEQTTDDSDDRYEQALDQIKQLTKRIDDSEALLADPDRGQKIEKKQEPEGVDYDKMTPEDFQKLILKKASELVDERIAPIQNKARRDELNKVQSEAATQLEKCRDSYQDFSKYESRVVEKAKELEKKYGSMAVLDFGIDALYAQERMADVKKRVARQETSTPPEKPSASSSATTKQAMTKEEAFDAALESLGDDASDLFD